MASPRDITLLPDAGPLITLAYAEALDLLLKPGWTVALVDMVLHEVTRSRTPTSGKVASWAAAAQVPVISTRTFRHFQQATIENPSTRTRNLGELAIQETMNDLALRVPPTTAVFLFEDHRIARASFLLPENCRKVSTRAFLAFLAQRGWIESAADIERRALQAGRAFSTLRFPP
ncbi:MAG: hypothetical protein V5B60_19255 [Accumulibacter sp.]|uniref:hypothetical protein n=1 Tax=Accumulibacter sp. TaxID=2053492 RepID=UPI002FC3CA61